MQKLQITASGGSYQIVISKDAVRQIPAYLDVFEGGKAVVVSDEYVWQLHGAYLSEVLDKCRINFNVVLIPQGETSKSLKMLAYLYEKFYESGLTRTGLVIAFGGGVVGDIAAHAAATYMRGVGLVQIPTTLLAQVDSSVGGKAAVNLKEGKNLVGSFYQPKIVFADTGVLSTLAPREFKCGMGEVIKYAMIASKELEELLLDGIVTEELERMIFLCCKCKTGFVEADERDASVRMMLNFGHTVGHAIEKYHNYEKYTHGEAVAIGMATAIRLGISLGVTPDRVWDKFVSLAYKHGIEYELQDDVFDLIPILKGDKKNTDEDITFILLKDIAEPIKYKIPVNTLQAVYRRMNP